MSQDNVALAQRFEDSWTRRDLDAALECVHTDFEFDWSESIGPFVGTYGGHDGSSNAGLMLWTLHGGKIVRVKMFQTKEEAFQAAGLSE